MLIFVSNNANIKQVELTLLVGPKVYGSIKCWCGLIQEPAHFVPKGNVFLLGMFRHCQCCIKRKFPDSPLDTSFLDSCQNNFGGGRRFWGCLGYIERVPISSQQCIPHDPALADHQFNINSDHSLQRSALYVSSTSPSSGLTSLYTRIWSTLTD